MYHLNRRRSLIFIFKIRSIIATLALTWAADVQQLIPIHTAPFITESLFIITTIKHDICIVMCVNQAEREATQQGVATFISTDVN